MYCVMLSLRTKAEPPHALFKQEADNVERFLAAHKHLGFVTGPLVLRSYSTHRYSSKRFQDAGSLYYAMRASF